MYETLMHTLRIFFGSGLLRLSLSISLGISIAVLAAYISPAFRTSLTRMKEREGWRCTLTTLGAGVFKFLLLFLLTRLFITTLAFQATNFDQQHGRITERNRSAVLMKWGYPHEQHELKVAHTRRRTWVTRQLRVMDGKKQRVLSESFWHDQEPPVQAVDGKLPTIISVKEEQKDVAVAQKSVVSADIDINVRNNARSLGNANYAGYEDTWQLRYVVTNRTQWQTTANMSFPLPAKTGLFDQMYIRLDSVDVLDSAKSDHSSIRWTTTMRPGTSCIVEIGYRSRGLEHLRYIPKRMSQTGHYRVTMSIDGVPPHKLDYPIGSMPPAENIAAITEPPYALTWKLDNALTSYDIGIKLPAAEQPAYHFAKLLAEAPVGLVLLLLLLTVPRIILNKRVRPELAVILGVGYCLHYTFMGRIADVIPGFILPFGISATILVTIVALFRLSDSDWRFLRVHDAIVFAFTAVLYPMAIVDADRTALWMQFFYLTVLMHCCILLVCCRIPWSRKHSENERS